MRLHPEDTFVPKTLSPCLGSRILVHLRKVGWLMGMLFVINLYSCRRSRSMSWPSVQQEVTAESRHHDARQGLYSCPRTPRASDGAAKTSRGDPARRQQSWQVSIHISRQRLVLWPIQPRIPGDQGSS